MFLSAPVLQGRFSFSNKTLNYAKLLGVDGAQNHYITLLSVKTILNLKIQPKTSGNLGYLEPACFLSWMSDVIAGWQAIPMSAGFAAADWTEFCFLLLRCHTGVQNVASCAHHTKRHEGEAVKSYSNMPYSNTVWDSTDCAIALPGLRYSIVRLSYSYIFVDHLPKIVKP